MTESTAIQPTILTDARFLSRDDVIRLERQRWALDEETRACGRRGIAQARQALADARRRSSGREPVAA